MSTAWCGSARTERVLDPTFTKGLEDLSLPDLRARRREAEKEEQEVSYSRRMLQGRVDLLRAELRRRAGLGDPLLPNLPRILADDPAAPRRQSRHVPVGAPAPGPSSEGGEGIATTGLTPDFRKLTDRELRGAVDSIEANERVVSDTRARIHRVLDRLSQELTRRYRDGSAQVDDLLSSVRRH